MIRRWRYRGIGCRLTLLLVDRGRPFVSDAGGPLVARAMVKCLRLIGQRVSVKSVIQSCTFSEHSSCMVKDGAILTQEVGASQPPRPVLCA